MSGTLSPQPGPTPLELGPTSAEPATATPRPGDVSDPYYLGLSRQLAAITRISSDATLAVGLTSAARGEGVTGVAVNLAAAASRDLRGRVLLVDANFEAPQAGQVAGAAPGAGLADLLATSDMEVTPCLQATPGPKLDVLSAGTAAAAHDLSVSTDRVRQLLAAISSRYQMVIFDLPVASELTSCFPIARCLDGVVLVVEAERTRNKAVARAKKQLLQSGAEVVGVVLNKRREHLPDWLYRRV